MGPLAEAADQTSSELIVISTSWENMMKTFVSDGWNETILWKTYRKSDRAKTELYHIFLFF